METTPAPATAFVAARTTLSGPRHAARNVPERFYDDPGGLKRTYLRTMCGIGANGPRLVLTRGGETVPWGWRPRVRYCTTCVRRVKALNPKPSSEG